MATRRRNAESNNDHDGPPEKRHLGERIRPGIDDGDDDSGVSGDSALAKEIVLREKGKSLACPFFKRYPTRYMRCTLRHRLTSASFVLQHLRRCHLPLHCPKCGQTFGRGKTSEREDHIRRAACPGARPIPVSHDGSREYVDPRQLIELHRRQKRGQSETERWYAMWRILFPGECEPDTPYVVRPEDEILDLVRHAMALRSPQDMVLHQLDWATVCSTLDSRSDGSSVAASSETDSVSTFGPSTPRPPRPVDDPPLSPVDLSEGSDDPFAYWEGWIDLDKVKERELVLGSEDAESLFPMLDT